MPAVRAKQGRYWVVIAKDHPRANKNGHVHEHVLIAERALGKSLSGEHPVHHFDNNGRNNANSNLLICEDEAYHRLIHARTRVFLAGGHADFDSVCTRCREVKSFTEFSSNRFAWNGVTAACLKCSANLSRARWRRLNPGARRRIP